MEGSATAGRAREKAGGKRELSAVVSGCLLLVSVAGGALLVWWALAFHPSNEQLWMVPIGLLVLGTPIVVWLSVFASDACRRFRTLWTTAPPEQVPAPTPRVAAPLDFDPER